MSSVTATASSVCGTRITGSATNACVVTCGPVLLNPVLVSGQFSFSFTTTPGHTSTVQYAESARPANWLPLTNFWGDGTTRTVADQLSPQGRFYRVLVQ